MPRRALKIIREEHASLSAMLRSMLLLAERGPDGDDPVFFDVLRAMLFYVDEFSERMHHPKESDLLFPRIAASSEEMMQLVSRLEMDHMGGEAAVRELQHLLLAWELMGDARRTPFMDAARSYVEFYLKHIALEESLILPQAEKLLTEEDWRELDAAFDGNLDPFSSRHPRDPAYDHLYARCKAAASIRWQARSWRQPASVA